MPTPIQSEKDIRIGDFYEDCAYHLCLCIAVGPEGDEDGVEGISLVDGSFPRSCSARHCGLRLITAEEAILWKFSGPPGEKLKPKDQWWNKS